MGFQVRDENSTEVMDGKVTVDENPIGQSVGPGGRYQGGQARAQEPTGSTEESPAGEPRSGARDQDGQGRVRGHGGPSAARSACSLQCAHLRGKQDRERRELSVLSVD